jgi:hypothetical protein
MSFSAVRKLRIGDDIPAQAEKNKADGNLFEKNRVLRIDFDPKVVDKVDRLYNAMEELSVIKKDYERRMKPLEAQVKQLKDELLEYAQEENVHVILGRVAMVEYSPRMSRAIAPVKFLQFLKDLGTGKRFWHYVDIKVTEPIKDFGENVLIASGVLDSSFNSFGTVKVKLKEG